jgi:hypothetical protein
MTQALTAVSSSATVVAPTAGLQTPRPMGLDAELAKCQGQLSDWVHCVSASTPEGKAKIEEISARIGAIKEALKQADSVPKPAPSALGNLLDVSA